MVLTSVLRSNVHMGAFSLAKHFACLLLSKHPQRLFFSPGFEFCVFKLEKKNTLTELIELNVNGARHYSGATFDDKEAY